MIIQSALSKELAMEGRKNFVLPVTNFQHYQVQGGQPPAVRVLGVRGKERNEYRSSKKTQNRIHRSKWTSSK